MSEIIKDKRGWLSENPARLGSWGYETYAWLKDSTHEGDFTITWCGDQVCLAEDEVKTLIVAMTEFLDALETLRQEAKNDREEKKEQVS